MRLNGTGLYKAQVTVVSESEVSGDFRVCMMLGFTETLILGFTTLILGFETMILGFTIGNRNPDIRVIKVYPLTSLPLTTVSCA